MATRLAERLRARLHDRIGTWPRLAARLQKSPPQAAAALFHKDGGAALERACRHAPALRRAIIARAERILSRDFQVSGHSVPPDGPWPWHTDWTVGHRWPAVAPYRIDFYGATAATTPDPKIPFELSRFAFLAQVALAAAVADPKDRARYLAFVRDTIQDWVQANPPGQTMAWYPMEPSVRCLALAQIHDLLALAEAPEEDLAQCRRLMALCAAYVRINHERAATSNSHYLSNLACLAVAGTMLRGAGLPTRLWRSWARRGLNREILAQFNADGGNFEGSTTYHLATLELCLLAHIALERATDGLSEDGLDAAAQARLDAALAYAAAIADDTHCVPGFGDNDDSHYLVLDLTGPWDVRPALTLGAALPGNGQAEQGLAAQELAAQNLVGQGVEEHSHHSVSAALLAGADPGRTSKPEPAPFCFPETGLAGVRAGALYLAMDGGPVGQGGLGGHGHNDLTAFVFRAGGQDLITDRGCSSYVRDQALRNTVRAGAAHAVLLVDGMDLGGLDAGPFRIITPAEPVPPGPTVSSDGDRHTITCGHDGFQGLTYRRTLTLDTGIPDTAMRAGPAWQLCCTDRLSPVSDHSMDRPVHRYFPLAPGLTVTPAADGRSAQITCPRTGSAWQMVWTPASQTELLEQPHHTGYDRAEPAWTLRITSPAPAGDKPWTLTWTLAPGQIPHPDGDA